MIRADLAVAAVSGIEPPATGNIAGIVENEAFTAIAGATVVVESSGLSATTNSDGYYLLEKVPVGEQDVTASADGYDSETGTVTVTENQTVTRNFVLASPIQEPGELSIIRFDLTDTSNPAWLRVRVDWTVSGDNLTTVKSELLSGDNVVESQISNISGNEASGYHELRTRGSADSVRLTVSDKSGSINQTKTL